MTKFPKHYKNKRKKSIVSIFRRILMNIKAISLTITCIAATLSFISLPAHALKATPVQSAALKEFTNYLNKIRSMSGEFTQIGPRGRVSNGIFYIVKPGKMRFEYAPPNPLIIISDGTWLTVKNRKRKKADQYPLTTTPLRLILDNNVNLNKEVKIVSILTSDENTSITFKDKSAFASGTLVLVFDQNAKQLLQWVVIDERGRRTSVSLSNLKYGIKVDPKMFKVKIPKSRRQRELEEGSR